MNRTEGRVSAKAEALLLNWRDSGPKPEQEQDTGDCRDTG